MMESIMDNHQAEFERLMSEKFPTIQLSKAKDGNYINTYTTMAFMGWVMAKTHSKLTEKTS